MSTVLVIAAHPDDEALGCGGTIARHVREGDKVSAVFMTDGVGARGSSDGAKERGKAADMAASILGFHSVTYYGFADNQLDGVPLLEVTKAIEKAVDEVSPQIIYTHHSGDLNIDHVITQKAVLTACRPMPGNQIEAIYGFEVLSSTEWAGPEESVAFRPAHFVNIASDFETKMNALESYDEEMRDFPHSRSYEAVKALATYRGAQVGVAKAEAFSVIRTLKV
jgi:LmbE family N-acetylglucosaminyl deacetylase